MIISNYQYIREIDTRAICTCDNCKGLMVV